MVSKIIASISFYFLLVFITPQFSSGQLRIKNEELRIESFSTKSFLANATHSTFRFAQLSPLERRGIEQHDDSGVCDAMHDFRITNDSIKADTAKKHSPRRAAIYSAVLPGLGQVYNKQYWKVPIIYAGGAVAGYLIYYNYSVYSNLHKAFRFRKDTLPDTNWEKFSVKTITGKLDVDLENFSDGEVLDLQNTYRKDLDLSVLLAFGIYALNIVDAVVYGHLYDFDVSEDLSLRLHPDFNYAQNGFTKPTMQLGLTYRF